MDKDIDAELRITTNSYLNYSFSSLWNNIFNDFKDLLEKLIVYINDQYKLRKDNSTVKAMILNDNSQKKIIKTGIRSSLF